MLTDSEIQSIVSRDNLVIRNLQITQGYYRLSQGLRQAVSHKNVSWCTFATHASRTAGKALRHELMPHILKSAMIRLAGYDNTLIFFNDALVDPGQALTKKHQNLLSNVLKKVSLLVSEGNLKVFAELAGPFASLIQRFSNDWAYDEQKLQAFLEESFQPGSVETGGQDFLIEAFSAFYRARYETNSKRKAEHVLHGNILVGLHEQIRLQPYIEQSLAVPMDALFDRRRLASPDEPDSLEKRVQKSGLPRQLMTYATTQMLMTITLPHRELKLGENVVPPTGIVRFPEELIALEDPRCRSLVREYEARMDTLSGSAASDWGNLLDRMSFIVDFFRSHQQNKRLFEPPFQEEQVSAIIAGVMPSGTL